MPQSWKPIWTLLAISTALIAASGSVPVDPFKVLGLVVKWLGNAKTFILALSSHTLAFLAGGLTFLVLGLIGLTAYITWLPYYFFPLKKKTAVETKTRPDAVLAGLGSQLPRGANERLNGDDVDLDPQLLKIGWIRLSLRMQDQADPSFLEPFDTPTYLLPSDELLVPPESGGT